MVFLFLSWGKDYLLSLVLLNPLEEKGNVTSFMKQHQKSYKMLAPGLLKILSLSDQYYFYYFFPLRHHRLFYVNNIAKTDNKRVFGTFKIPFSLGELCEDNCFVQAVVMQ